MSSIIEVSNSMVNIIKQALITCVDNPEALAEWITKCSKNLRVLTVALRKNVLSVGVKRNLESNVAKIKGFRAQMKALRQQGAGIKPKKENRSHRIKWEDINSAFISRIRTGTIINLRHIDPALFIDDSFSLFNARIKRILVDFPSLKINTDFCGEFIKESGLDVIYELKHFQTKNAIVTGSTDMHAWWLENIKDNLLVQLEEFSEKESSWALSAIVNLTVNINFYEPLVGSSYLPLPDSIKNKQACINVCNEDQMCFAWAVVSALHPVKDHTYRPANYPHPATVLNLEGINFPMDLGQVRKFEQQNSISVNVFIIKYEQKVLPVHLTKNKQDPHVNLLFIQDPQDLQKNHYVWIKDLSRLVSKQTSVHKSKLHVCDRCLKYFYSAEKLKNHELDCSEINECKVIMPWREEDKSVQFKNFKNKIPVPFIIYADYESLLKPISQTRGKKTELYLEHEAYSIGYYFKCQYDDSLSYYKSYRGPECTKWFMDELKQIVEDIEPVFWAPQPMDLTTQEEQAFQDATQCHICCKPFLTDDTKVRDHNHMTSEYRGAAHDVCNLKYEDSKTIPIVFHNLSGYDAHFLIRDLAQEIPGNINLLPINKEKYISFSKYIEGSQIILRFIDSFRFMSSSLDKLASDLDRLPIVRKEFPHLNEEQFQLLTRKGAFPYEYMTSWERLEEPQLPPMHRFESSLATANLDGLEHTKKQEVLESRRIKLIEDYEHAQNVWREFECTTLGAYSDMYMKMDVLLLASVFENFRETCYEAYGLDAAHYVSAPGLTWDAMLKYTGVTLELLTDIDMLLFTERGLRGGLSQCSHRYAKANNPYMAEYDPEQQSSYLMYYDVNNLYGWAMSEFLPKGDFKWCNKRVDASLVPDDSPIGYIFEVDLEYPQELHDLHQDLPFCPQKMVPPGGKETKLLTTMFTKERYVIHYRALKQAFKHGVRVIRVRRILQFSQSAWMKPLPSKYSGLDKRFCDVTLRGLELNPLHMD